MILIQIYLNYIKSPHTARQIHHLLLMKISLKTSEMAAHEDTSAGSLVQVS